MPAPIDSVKSPPPRQPDPTDELRRACAQFEAIFLRQILKQAHLDRVAGQSDEGANLYGDLVIESLADAVAKGGGLGLAETLYRQLAPENAQADADSTAADPHPKRMLKRMPPSGG